jgi:hypothetical protein
VSFQKYLMTILTMEMCKTPQVFCNAMGMMVPIQPLEIAVEDLVSREHDFSSDRTFTITVEELYGCLPESFVKPKPSKPTAPPRRRYRSFIPVGLSALVESSSSGSGEDDGAHPHSSDPAYADSNGRNPSSDVNMSGDDCDVAGDKEVTAAGRAMQMRLPEGGESSRGTGVVRAAARVTRQSKQLR